MPHKFRFSSPIIRTVIVKQVMHPQRCLRGLLGGERKDLNGCHTLIKSEALNQLGHFLYFFFHHRSQTTALFPYPCPWEVPRGRRRTLHPQFLASSSEFVPPRGRAITVTVTCFVLSHRRRKIESLFFTPLRPLRPLLLLSPRCSLLCIPASHSVNCVHFNYDLISEEGRARGRGGGGCCWSPAMPHHARVVVTGL